VISNLPDWITAGTAVTAVLGGLAGVYTTTQSRMDVADERLANVIEVVESMALEQQRHDIERRKMAEDLARDQVSLTYLKEGQDRIYAEVNRLNEVLTAK
jgi:predicted alpha/beta-hydrolase family hydrolase